jgi:hypothetical protein
MMTVGELLFLVLGLFVGFLGTSMFWTFRVMPKYTVFETVIQDYEISKSEIKICRPDTPWKID